VASAACGRSFLVSAGDPPCVASRSPPPGVGSTGSRSGETPRWIVTIDSLLGPPAVSTSTRGVGFGARSPGGGATMGASGIGVGSGAAGGSAGGAGDGTSAVGGCSGAGCSAGGCSGPGCWAGGCSAGGSAGGCSAGGSSVGGCSGAGSSGGGDSGGCWGGDSSGTGCPSTAEPTSSDDDPASARASAASRRPRSVANAHTARRARELTLMLVADGQPIAVAKSISPPPRSRQTLAYWELSSLAVSSGHVNPDFGRFGGQ
jgi:hypothetical protein